MSDTHPLTIPIMKSPHLSRRWFYSFLIGLNITFMLGCKDDQPAACSAQLRLFQALPNNNPSGAPFLLQGSGFGPEMELYLGNEEVPIQEYNDSFLVAKVPRGLLGRTTLSLQLGGCTATLPFEITASYPSNIPASPPTYILPQPGLGFGIHLTTDEALSLINPYDSTHRIRLEDSNFGIPKDENVTERHGSFQGTGSWYGLNNSADTVYSEFSIDEETVFYLNLYRKDPESPFLPDILIGSLQTVFDLEINGDRHTSNYLVTTSTLTGRQYIFSIYL